jgi:hypothetical protein
LIAGLAAFSVGLPQETWKTNGDGGFFQPREIYKRSPVDEHLAEKYRSESRQL